MKFLRVILNILVWAIAVIVVLVAIAFTPVVQTWVAQTALARQPAIHGSLGSLWAGFGRVVVSDLHLKAGGAELTLPSIEAELPLTVALRNQGLLVRKFVAKGWTLDLRQTPGPAGAGEPVVPAPGVDGVPKALAQAVAASAQIMARISRGTLSRWALPCDVSLDGVDLEGDVVVATTAYGAPARVHVIIKGGGLAAGREGTFAIDASCEIPDSEPAAVSLASRGRLAISMKSPRTFSRAEVKAEISAKGGPFPEGLTLSADVAAERGAGEETYSLVVGRDSRDLATVCVRFPEGTNLPVGTWKLDLKDSDIVLFAPGSPLPRIRAAGEGRFETDVAFTRVHALGRLSAALSHLGVLAPSLERLGEVTMDAGFDAFRTGHSIRVDHLSVALTGAGPAAVVQSLQPFEFDEHSGDFRPADPEGDWLELSLRGFPLAWLSGPAGGFALSGADAAGEFIIRAKPGGFALRSKTPLAAAAVSVQEADRTVGRNLDLSASLLAEYGPSGWQIQATPLMLGSGGRRLATIEARAARPAGPDQPVAIAGSWSADLRALDPGAVVLLDGFAGRSASGDFSAKVGGSTELDGRLTLVGPEEGESITAGVHVEVEEGGRVSFLAPVKIALAPGVSDLSVEGTSIHDDAGSRLYLRLTGKDVALEHLRLLAAPFAPAGGASLAATPGPGMSAGVRDRIPFWGDWVGRVTIAFDRLKAGDLVFDDVGGAFHADHGSVRLEGGHCRFAGQRLANVEGAISFDAAAEFPYDLKATASLDQVDVGPFFPASAPGGDPIIEGRFSVAGALAGNGINLGDLAGRTQEEFRLTSTAGIVRVLKTDVDEAIPAEDGSSVSEDLGRVGSAVGAFFGVEERKGSARKSVSPTAEAVIEFLNDISEIGFDQVTLTAIRGSDRTIHLVDIAMTAGDARLTGSGQITCVEGRPLREQTLSVDLQFWARGGIARHLSTAGLLSTRKDDLGYALLGQTIHLGGTLEHIDKSQWHNLLVKAAARNPAGPKKGR